MDYILLGRNIRKYRKICDFTQEKLSEMADITPAYLSQIERADRIPSLDTIVKLADSLNVTVDDLVENKMTQEQLEKIFKVGFTDEQINLLHKLFDNRSEKERNKIFKIINAALED